MHSIVDTNVLVIANDRNNSQASPDCVLNCITKLGNIMESGVLVIDSHYLILGEYRKNASDLGQPGFGDRFLLWALRCQGLGNPQCEQVNITVIAPNEFDEFPKDPPLAGFDPSDRKFVAVCLAHPHHPPIANAVDSDWQHFQAALENHGVTIEFLCP